MKQKRQRGKKIVQPQTITKAVTHICLIEVNPGKLAALDALAPVYLALCQEYVTLFCTQEMPNTLRDPRYLIPIREPMCNFELASAARLVIRKLYV